MFPFLIRVSKVNNARFTLQLETLRRLMTALSLVLACGLVLCWQFPGWLQPSARAATASTAPAQATGAPPQWTRSGPHAGFITALATSKSSPSTVYAYVNATDTYYGIAPTGLFKSTDAGAHWSKTNYPTLSSYSRRVISIAIDPTNTSVVYAGTTSNGVLKSTDGGQTWAGPFGAQDADFMGLAIDPVTTTTLYSTVAGRGIYKSTDGGQTWTTASAGIHYYTLNNLRVDPSNANVVYAVGGDAGPGQFGGVYKSTDGGASWNLRIAGLPYTSVYALALDPSNTSTLYLATTLGVFKSTDAAASWAASGTGLPNGVNIVSVDVNPADTTKLYAASSGSGGIYQSNDAGASWALVGTDTTKFNSVTADAAGVNVYAGSAGAGVFRSVGGGAWAEADEGLPFASVRNLVVDPNNPATIYAGSGESIYKSVDRGENWAVTGLPQYDRPIMGLAADPAEAATFYAAPDYVGVVKTTDGGLNWAEVFDAGNTNAEALAIAASSPRYLYFSKYGVHIYRGTEGGGAWTQVGSPLNAWALAVDPSNSSVVYAAYKGIAKSTNAGVSWSALSNYDASTVTVVNGIAIDPTNPAILYAYSTGSAAPVHKSADGGATWSPVSSGLPASSPGSYDVRALVIDPVNPSTLYAASYGAAESGGGIYRSADGGASWSLFQSPLGFVNALTVDPTGKTLYAGADDGVYKTQTPSQAFNFASDLFDVAESAGAATITVTRADTSGTVTVNYATSDGSARAGADYVASSGSLTFAPGEASKTFSVTILDDTLDEFDEGVNLTLTSADGSATVLARAALVIVDDDPPPVLNVGDVSAPEGDFDNTNFVFHVSLSAPSAKTVTANIGTSDGTAIGGNDYYAYGGPYTLTFAPGETDKTVTVIVRGDLDVEPDETFSLNATNVVNATPGHTQGRGTILNDDFAPTVSLSINDVSVLEGNYGTTDAVFTVSLSGATTKTVKVDYLPTGGQGTIIVPFGGTLTFAPGETSKTVTVSVICNTRYDPDEQVGVKLSNPRNALMARDTGILTVRNDEAPPTLSVSDISVREGDSGQKEAVFTITLSSPIDSQASFTYTTVPGTATELTPGKIATGLEDYGWVSGAWGVPVGLTKTTITVPIYGDTRPEPNETFFLRISDPTNGVTITKGEGECVIIDDDGSVAPVFQFSAAEYEATEDSGQAVVTVMRVGDLSTPASVTYSTRTSANPRSASDRSDYTAAYGTLKFAPGEESKTFNVLLTDDAFAERDPNLGDEFIDLALSDPTGGVALGTPQTAIITILDNDAVNGIQNPIDASSLYVRQHYHDFLNREPDASGLQFWMNNIEGCGTDQQCRAVKRVDTSAAFFLSIEFQQTGYLVERMYKAAYGDATDNSTLGGAHQLGVPAVRLQEFLSDTQEIQSSPAQVVVGQGNWQQQLEDNKNAFALGFVQRQRFIKAYLSSLTADQFVNQLNANAGGVLSASDVAQLDSVFGGPSASSNDAAKRAQVLRSVAENATLQQREFDRAFVLMQYFGYLRRNPDDAPDSDYTGYDFWLQKLDQFHGNYAQAEMVKAFISSTEYRQRFGQ